MGSLIKSPGGTIVPGGGYIAGRADLVEAAAARLTAPGVGLDAGCVPGETLRLMYQGVGCVWGVCGGEELRVLLLFCNAGRVLHALIVFICCCTGYCIWFCM